MRRFLFALFLLVTVSFACHAQEVKVQELLDVESKLTLKKLNDELGKQQVDAKSATLPKLEKVIVETPKPREPFTVAVFGVSPNYSGYMNFNGSVVLVSKGDQVFGRSVVDISKTGITLLTLPKPKVIKSRKSHLNRHKKSVNPTKFYPIVAG